MDNDEGLDSVESEKIDVVKLTDSFTFYTVSIFYLIMVVTCALAIDDLTLVFGMIAAICESTLNYIFPGIIFLATRKQCRVLVTIFVILGLVYFTVSNYFNLIKL